MSRVLIACATLFFAPLVFAEDKKPEPKATVSGALALDDAPLAECAIVFHPVQPDKMPFKGTTDKDGKYSVDLPAGEYTVTCLKVVVDEKTKKAVTVTPAKFADPKTSGLKVTIKDGKQSHDFVLKSK